MPRPMSARHGRLRRFLLGGVVVILIVVNGAGLCVTYGFPEIAWLSATLRSSFHRDRDDPMWSCSSG